MTPEAPPKRGSFADLATRMVTGVVLAAVGLTAVWAGGWWFAGLVAVIVGVLVWELARMLGGGARRALVLAALAAGVTVAGKLVPPGLALPLLALTALTAGAALERNRILGGLMTAVIVLASFGLIVHRDDFGLTWMLWLVLVVAATDILGYFAGRVIGGPKFWPRVSPKKTWSGTIAGWIGSGLLGWAFMGLTGAGIELVAISVVLSLASQLGDIAESALKRRVGVKDSSNLLPGHGGVYDRFDGLVGAAFVLVIVETVTAFPPPPV